MRILTAATVLSIGTVSFLALAVPRLTTGYDEYEVRRSLQEATPGDTLDERVRAAVDEGDIDGALQYEALSKELGKPIAPETAASLVEAQGTFATIMRNTGDFAGAYVTGHADSAAGLAGAIISDLTVVGDVRDIVSEGGKAAVGEEYSEFLLALAAIGLAAEGVTIATGGSSLVVKAGVSVLKVAKRTGNMTADLTRRLVHLARASARPAAPAAGLARGGDGAVDITRAAARAELGAIVTSVNTMAANAGAADAVRLMRTVKTSDDARELATMSSRFGRRTRAVVELTGKTSMRGFRAALKGFRLLVAFLWSLVAWIAGLVALRFVKGALRLNLRLVRGAFGLFLLPAVRQPRPTRQTRATRADMPVRRSHRHRRLRGPEPRMT
ncbi:hypothetical protein L1787_23855 [Acuticoccus sp. M5D2P5]|uniref:hypothetical protein n=1 Tax=Acuticoccus kalidii TaxID=2910977 RepID=UPI001F3B10C0|nr:hypothetical protein [Acuticoccus kalidii]MCF3936433.1 hypothetical protein [Acuticoccus kalidii]